MNTSHTHVLEFQQVTHSNRRFGNFPRKSGISPESLLLCKSLIHDKGTKNSKFIIALNQHPG